MAMRIRLIYTKTASLRYTGNLDMQRSWERTIRRARLPIAYSQGFHPQPRINQASALPLGFTSRAEMLDIWLDADLPIDLVRDALERTVPPGIAISDVFPVAPQDPSVQTITAAAEYQVSFRGPGPQKDEIQAQVARILQAEHLPRQRREKDYDLRPLIEGLEVANDPGQEVVGLWMRLSARASATGRPEEVLDEMGFSIADVRVERTRLILSS